MSHRPSSPFSARRSSADGVVIDTSRRYTQMNRIRRLAITTTIATVASTFVVASPAAAAIDRATMALETSYVLKASLDYGAATIAAAESITIRNVSGSSISKVNLSVTPRAFGELTSISGFSVDTRPVSARWTNNSNLELQLGKVLATGASAVIRLRFAVRATGVIGTSLEGRLSKANGIMQVSHWFPIVSDGHATRYPGDAQYTRVAKRIRLELTTNASSLRIAAPGTVITRTSRYHVYEIKNARDFAFGASALYQVATGSASGITVAAYYTTGNGPSAVGSAVVGAQDLHGPVRQLSVGPVRHRPERASRHRQRVSRHRVPRPVAVRRPRRDRSRDRPPVVVRDGGQRPTRGAVARRRPRRVQCELLLRRLQVVRLDAAGQQLDLRVPERAGAGHLDPARQLRPDDLPEGSLLPRRDAKADGQSGVLCRPAGAVRPEPQRGHDVP